MDLATHRGGERRAATYTVRTTTSLSAPNMLYEGHGGGITAVKFSPSGQSLISASLDRTLRLWDLRGNSYGAITPHRTGIMDVCWIDDEWVASCAADGTVAVSDTIDRERVCVLKRDTHRGVANAIAYLGDSKLLVTVGNDGRLLLWDWQQGKVPVCQIDTGLPITSLAVDSNGIIYHAGVGGLITARDPRNLDGTLCSLEGHRDVVIGLTAGPKYDKLASASLDNSVISWDLGEKRPLRTFACQINDIEKELVRPSFSSDASHIACGSADRTAVVWSTSSSEERTCYKLPGHSGAVTCVDWHPSENILVSGSTDTKIFLADLDLEACEKL